MESRFPVTLRRINNARGHLQFRYESKKQAALRDYLTNVFGGLGHANGVLRVSELTPHVFLFEPVSAGRQTIASLSLCNRSLSSIVIMSVCVIFTSFRS